LAFGISVQKKEEGEIHAVCGMTGRKEEGCKQVLLIMTQCL
jgi:hypothetical protein